MIKNMRNKMAAKKFIKDITKWYQKKAKKALKAYDDGYAKGDGETNEGVKGTIMYPDREVKDDE